MARLKAEQLRLLGTEEPERIEKLFEAERHELFGVIVGEQPDSNVPSEGLDRGVVEGADGGFVDRGDHLFGLAVGPRVLRLGEPVLDPVLGIEASKNMGGGAALGPPLVLHELYAIVGQNRVDLVRDSDQQGFEETS